MYVDRLCDNVERGFTISGIFLKLNEPSILLVVLVRLVIHHSLVLSLLFPARTTPPQHRHLLTKNIVQLVGFLSVTRDKYPILFSKPFLATKSHNEQLEMLFYYFQRTKTFFPIRQPPEAGV